MVGSIQYIPGRRLDPGVFFSNRATSRRLRTFPERRRVLSNAWCANHTRVVYAGAILSMRFVPAGKMVDFSACTVYFGEGRVAELQNFSWETRENWFRQTRRRISEGSISVWWSHKRETLRNGLSSLRPRVCCHERFNFRSCREKRVEEKINH